MRSLFALLPAALAILFCFLFARPARADEPIRLETFREAEVGLHTLKLRDGRRLYKTPRELRFQHPFLCAANDAERAAGKAYVLTWEKVHDLFEPIGTVEGARELLFLFHDAVMIADAAHYERLVNAFAGRPELAEVSREVPHFFGATVGWTDDAFGVRGLLYDRKGGVGRLQVLAVTLIVPRDGGPVERHVDILINGPHQSWQTGPGGGGGELQRDLDAFRKIAADCFPAEPTLEAFKNVLQPGVTFTQAREAFGTPDDDRGSGVHIYVYSLPEGEILVGVPGLDNVRVIYALFRAGGETTTLFDLQKPF